MKYNFLTKQSRIYDFLAFPRCLHLKEEIEEEDDYKEVIGDDYLTLLDNIKKRIAPFSKEIETFYLKQFYSQYDFADLMINATNPFKYEDEQDYLDSLLSLDEHTIKKYIVFSIMDISQDHEENIDETMNLAAKISSNHDEIFSFIKGLEINASFKWNLFLIVEEPVKYIQLFVELLNKLQPIFYDVYAQFETKIIKYGQYIEDYLNKNNNIGLKKLTSSVIDDSIADEENNRILVSLLLSYSIIIRTTLSGKYIIWGLRVEEAMQKINEINQNKTRERVLIFKNLGDQTRYEVLKLISTGVSSLKDIADNLGVSSATVSYHINALINSKVITINKQNKKLGYTVNYPILEGILEDFKQDLGFPNHDE